MTKVMGLAALEVFSGLACHCALVLQPRPRALPSSPQSAHQYMRGQKAPHSCKGAAVYGQTSLQVSCSAKVKLLQMIATMHEHSLGGL